MSDYNLPELPSDEELGITEEDLEHLPDDEKPELTEEDRAALLGETPGRDKAPPAPPPPGKRPPRKARAKPHDPVGPRSKWRGPVMLLVLLMAAWLASSQRTLPRPGAANAPDTAFSSARAMAHLVEIARAAHPPGSPEHDNVRAYLIDQLGDLGLEPQVQVTTSMIGLGTFARGATVRNIVARIAGRSSSGAIVLTAHYDGRGLSLAAGDDGAGVVTILETARALLSGPPIRNDVILLLTDGEELGLLGARAFVDEHPWMDHVAVVLSVEMRGGGGPSIMFETGTENGWIVQKLAEAGPRILANSASQEVYRRLPNDTDFTPFREAGTQGLNFAAAGRASVYHQTYDRPSNLSEATLQHHGLQALAMIRALGEEALTEVDAPDVTFFSVPFLGLVVYNNGFTWPLTAAVLVLGGLVFLAVRRTGGGWPGILVGLGTAIVAGALSAGAGLGMIRWLPRFHPEYGSLQGSAFHHEGWYMLALVAGVFTLVTALFALARRWFTAAELTWGALLIPLTAVLYVSVQAPAAAMNLQWPLAGALLGTVILLLPTGPRLGTVTWVLAALFALPVLTLLVPLAELLWLGLSFGAAMGLGVMVWIMTLLLLPALDRLREPDAWWAPATGALLALGFLGLGIRAATPTAERPAPSTLAYAYDHGTDEALWITDTSEQEVDRAARAWAEGRAGSAFTERRSLEAFGFGDREAKVVTAVGAKPPEVEVWVLEDAAAGGTRHLRLAVRSAVGAELIQFRVPEGGSTRITALNGRVLPLEDATVVEHWGTPVPAVLLDVEVAPDAELEMDVVEHLLRPEELVGTGAFQRPPELAPDITWLSDRAMIRTPASALELGTEPPPFPLVPESELGTGPSEGQPAETTPESAPPPDSAMQPDTTAGLDTADAPDDTVGVPDTAVARPDTTAAGGP
jgi:hypothetical protein